MVLGIMDLYVAKTSSVLTCDQAFCFPRGNGEGGRVHRLFIELEKGGGPDCRLRAF